MALVEHPGISIIGVDPGGTTGVAIWDAWDGCWYFDQLDAGMGRKVKHHLNSGTVESPEFIAVGKMLGLIDSHGFPRLKAKNDPRIVDMVEYQCTQLLMDIFIAAGPGALIVKEDFVLGWGDVTRVGSAGREGLSPVRMLAKMSHAEQDLGILNGDAWRNWRGFGAASKDKRGVVVRSWPLTLPERCAEVRAWRETGVDTSFHRGPGVNAGKNGTGLDDGVLWRGGGSHVIMSMPSRKLEVPDEAIKELGLWWPGHIHAMDALRHAVVVSRKIRARITNEWKPLYRADGRKT